MFLLGIVFVGARNHDSSKIPQCNPLPHYVRSLFLQWLYCDKCRGNEYTAVKRCFLFRGNVYHSQKHGNATVNDHAKPIKVTQPRNLVYFPEIFLGPHKLSSSSSSKNLFFLQARATVRSIAPPSVLPSKHRQ